VGPIAGRQFLLNGDLRLRAELGQHWHHPTGANKKHLLLHFCQSYLETTIFQVSEQRSKIKLAL